MRPIIDALKALKLWQIGVLLGVLAVGIGSAYGAYAIVTRSDQADLNEDQQLIPVTRGDLVNEVSVNGGLVFPNRATLNFGADGTIAEVLVLEGQTVVEGQALARLDAETLAFLEKAIAQAEWSLQDAKDALDSAKNPYTPLDRAEAESKVANARLSLENAQVELATLLDPNLQDIAQTESKVVSAVAALQVSEDALDRLLQPTAHDIAKAESDVMAAKIAVEKASTTLVELKNGSSQEEITKAQSQIDAAETILANAQRDLTLNRKQWDDNLQAAEESRDAGIAGYQKVIEKWLGIDIGETEANMLPVTLLESWGVDLATLFDPSLRFDDITKRLYAEGLPSNDPTTPWDESIVYIWINMFPSSIAATCEDGIVPLKGVCIQKEIDDGWSTYDQSRDSLDTVHIQMAKVLATAESLITQHEESLAATQEVLAETIEPASLLDIEAQEKQLQLTLADLQEAEDTLVSLKNGPDEVDVQAARTQVALTRANLVQAEVDLAELMGGPNSLETDATRKQVDVALAVLNKAKEDLTEVLAGADPLKVTLRESEVAAIHASLNTAKQRLEDATLKAPWDGIISKIHVEVGQQVNIDLRAFEIVDPTVIWVDGIVDEIDVLFIHLGARASVTMDALPGQTLAGTVSYIAIEPTTQQGVVSYPIGIELQTPPGLELPEGLSAVVTVVIREELDVLMVPIDALYGSFEHPIVRVMNNGQIEDRMVVLGNNDDYWVVVEDGVVEAEHIVMETERANTGGGFGGFRALFGGSGGFGGGGRAGGGGE